MDSPDRLQVAAYSGYKANERPLSFVLNGKTLKVVEVLDRWFGQSHDYFKVLADDGLVYLLKWHRTLDEWYLVKRMDKTAERVGDEPAGE